MDIPFKIINQAERLRIGVVVQATDTTSPNSAGPVEKIAASLALSLANDTRQVAEVHVWATADSLFGLHSLDPETNKRIIFHPYRDNDGREVTALRPRGVPSDDIDWIERFELMPRALREIAKLKLDIVNLHTLRGMEAMSDMSKKLRRKLPLCVATCHWDQTDPRIAPSFKMWGNRPVTGISRSQIARGGYGNHKINFVGMAYNGIDERFFRPAYNFTRLPTWLAKLAESFPAMRNGYATMVARVAPEKGQDYGIKAAIAAGIPVILAGKIDESEQGYYEQVIKPLIDMNPELVHYLGELKHDRVLDLQQHATVMLHVNARFPEPFGLGPTQSLLVGTPVVAVNYGALKEIVTHGRSGYLVKRTKSEEKLIKGLVAGIHACTTYDRSACRTDGERFSIGAMSQSYLDIFNRLLKPIEDVVVPPFMLPAPTAVARIG